MNGEGYLDTDGAHNSFDDLLGKLAFIGYLYNIGFCTAVMVSENGTFIKGIKVELLIINHFFINVFIEYKF